MRRIPKSESREYRTPNVTALTVTLAVDHTLEVTMFMCKSFSLESCPQGTDFQQRLGRNKLGALTIVTLAWGLSTFLRNKFESGPPKFPAICPSAHLSSERPLSVRCHPLTTENLISNTTGTAGIS